MEITNRYFIVDMPISQAILDIVVENEDSLRLSIDGNYAVVKLYKGDTINHSVLNGYEEYTHSEILLVMQNEQWNPEI